MVKIIAFMNAFWAEEAGGMSGGDRRFLEVAKWWKRQKIAFEIFAPRVGVAVCRTEGLDGFCRTTTPSWVDRLGLVPAYLLRVVAACWQIPKFKSDLLLYSSSDFWPDVLPALAAKLLNRKSRWVAWLHLVMPNPFYGYQQYYVKQKRLQVPSASSVAVKLAQILAVALMRWQADVILVVNQETKSYLVGKGCESRRIHILSNGVDFEGIQRLTAAEEHFDAAFIGRFHPQKGLMSLLKIWKLVCQEKKEARLALIGGGSVAWERKVRGKIREYGLEKNIKLFGPLTDYSRFQILKSAKVYLCPSFYESWGIVNLEAMACGLPVVAWDLPVYREIFGQGMATVPLGDCRLFAETVLAMLGDGARCGKLGKEAWEFAQDYRWEQIAAREWEVVKCLV